MDNKLIENCAVNHNINEKQIIEIIDMLEYKVSKHDEKEFLEVLGTLADMGIKGKYSAEHLKNPNYFKSIASLVYRN